ncbi:MAG: DNA recombination protein RmuC [Gemmatimonadetes bacterium]|nr:DNA recombination protein RmuC [Gemmatimonadota bacterium]
MELVYAALALAIVLLGWLLVLHVRLGRRIHLLEAGPASDSLALLQREIQAVREGVDGRLRDHLSQAQEISERLGRLQSATENVERLGREIAELQRILKPPQLRGGFGERMLSDLLADMLPRDRFRVQYTYPKKRTRVDAAILLDAGRILPIDAKFPLDNFRRYVELRDSGLPEAQAARRDLTRDVKRHIDDIAQRYLSPEDGAADVALMYIPSESVYYEVALRGVEGEEEPLADYAIRRRVVPVSPNSFHAYLSVILTGLRGFQLQESAREILGHLSQLRAGVAGLRGELDRAIRQADQSLKNLRDVDEALRAVETRLETVHRLAPQPDSALPPTE